MPCIAELDWMRRCYCDKGKRERGLLVPEGIRFLEPCLLLLSIPKAILLHLSLFSHHFHTFACVFQITTQALIKLL